MANTFLDYLEMGLTLRQAAASAGISEEQALQELRKAKSVDTEVEIQRLALTTKMARALDTLDMLLASEDEKVALGACKLIIGTLSKPGRSRTELQEDKATEDMWTHAARGLPNGHVQPALGDDLQGGLPLEAPVETGDAGDDSAEAPDHAKVSELLKLLPCDMPPGALELQAAHTAQRREKDKAIRPPCHLRSVPSSDSGSDLPKDGTTLDSEDGQPTLFE